MLDFLGQREIIGSFSHKGLHTHNGWFNSTRRSEDPYRSAVIILFCWANKKLPVHWHAWLLIMHKKHKIVVYWHAWLLFIVLAKKQKKNNYCLFIMHNKHKIVVYWHVWLLIMHNKQKIVGAWLLIMHNNHKIVVFLENWNLM